MMLAVLLFCMSMGGSGQADGTEVTFQGFGGLELSGTVLKPPMDMVCPGVLLLPGSGPTDRNGNQPPWLVTDLLKQVAADLAAHGIATLRFDKRATPRYATHFPKTNEGLNEFFSFQAFQEDAKAGLQYLRSYPGIDSDRVGILGHSEGGLISLAIAAEGAKEGPCLVVLCATAGRTLGPVIREQVGANLKQSTLSQAEKQKYLDYIDLANKEIAAHGKVPPNPPAGMASVYPAYAGNLLRSYLTLDPVVLAKKVKVPTLVVQGDSDAQVSSERDYPLLVAALESRSGAVTGTSLVKAGSHNFKQVSGTNRHAFAGPVLPAMLSSVRAWLRENLKP